MHFLALFSSLLIGGIPSAFSGEDIFRTGLPAEKVILGCLDKVTARVSTVEAPVGEVISFGNLKIMVRKAEKSRPEDPSETTAFIEILEEKPNEAVSIIFRGWMFASTPSASAMEHPVYDVWVKDSLSAKGKEDRNVLPEPAAQVSTSQSAQKRTPEGGESGKDLDALLEELEEMEIPGGLEGIIE